ncbi:MAG TPA: LL-diaminopimelate aminotransferase [Actinomycetota bacterium]|nr:LL-diaminopimelate aminotransferase [Actinomycetota bacterium]
MRAAHRIESLPPYLFAELDRKVSETKAKGVDVISFAIGDPDRPTPAHIVEAGARALADPANHRYPSYYGMHELREAIAGYYWRRFEVSIDPETQVLPLIGSKEGIAHLATAFVDPGDAVLVSEPGYPVYATSAILAGGSAISIPLTANEGFLPRLDQVSPDDAAASKILWLNFPGNPTSAVADLDLFEAAVDLCRKHDLLLAHDAAYVELTYDGYTAPSVLQARGAEDVAIEFGSLSKTYNMTGWRVGWVVGAAEAIEAIGRVKTNIDSGIFNALQRAGIVALTGPQECIQDSVEVYRRRRDAVVEALNSSGWTLKAPLGSIYVWAPVPSGETSISFSQFLLEEAGVVVAPGSGYGAHGEGYVRFSLTLPDDRLDDGMERVARAMRSRT